MSYSSSSCERIYTVSRAAKYLGVHPATVLGWINRGELAAAPACESLTHGRAGVRRWLIRHSAIVAFVARHERPAKEPAPATCSSKMRSTPKAKPTTGRPWPKPTPKPT